MTKWEFKSNLQVVVEGLDSSDYYLKIDAPATTTLCSLSGTRVLLGYRDDYCMNTVIYEYVASSLGMPNADGAAFYYTLANGDYKGDLTFTLYNTSGVQQGTSYTVTDKEISCAVGTLTNVKINKSKFGL